MHTTALHKVDGSVKLVARYARKVDTLPESLMDEVLAKVATIFE